MNRVMLLVLFAGISASCAHQPRVVDLSKALELGVSSSPSAITAGREAEFKFTLRNSSNTPLSLCSPNGVTTYLQCENPPYIWPIIIHGWTTDTFCSGAFDLAPGEEKTFVERGGIRSDLPTSSPKLIGKISLHCDGRKHSRCADAQLETSRFVSVEQTR